MPALGRCFALQGVGKGRVSNDVSSLPAYAGLSSCPAVAHAGKVCMAAQVRGSCEYTPTKSKAWMRDVLGPHCKVQTGITNRKASAPVTKRAVTHSPASRLKTTQLLGKRVTGSTGVAAHLPDGKACCSKVGVHLSSRPVRLGPSAELLGLTGAL